MGRDNLTKQIWSLLVLRHPFWLLAILLAHSQSATAGEMWKLPSQSRNFFSNSWGYDSYPYFLVSSKEIWKDRGQGHLSVPEHFFHGDQCRFSHVPFCFTFHPLLHTNKDRFQRYMKKTQLPKEQDLHLVNFHEISRCSSIVFTTSFHWWSGDHFFRCSFDDLQPAHFGDGPRWAQARWAPLEVGGQRRFSGGF